MDPSIPISLVAMGLSILNIGFISWWKRYERREMEENANNG